MSYNENENIDMKLDTELETELETDIDTEWINEFNQIDNNYKHLYLEDLSYILLNCIYINNGNEIIQIKKEKIMIDETKNLITKDKLVKILKRYNNNNGKIYNVSSILKYNIDLEPENIKYYINENELKEKEKNPNNFIEVVKKIDNIHWKRSIKMFEDLNNLIIIFYQNYKDTRRILFKNNKSLKKNLNNKMIK
jgi:hypothetical protein